jgi:hypothetical protein
VGSNLEMSQSSGHCLETSIAISVKRQSYRLHTKQGWKETSKKFRKWKIILKPKLYALKSCIRETKHLSDAYSSTNTTIGLTKNTFHSEILASLYFNKNKILSPGLENKHTLKCCSGNFPT